MRIELKEGFMHHEVTEDLNNLIGHIEDGVTWFWSCGEFYHVESKYHPGLMEPHVTPEGVKIFKHVPDEVLSFIFLKWS